MSAHNSDPEELDENMGLPPCPDSEDEEEKEKWLVEYERRVEAKYEEYYKTHPLDREELLRREAEKNYYEFEEEGGPINFLLTPTKKRRSDSPCRCSS